MGRQHTDQLAKLLDLLAEDSWRSVHAGELEVRPPGAPTTEPDLVGDQGCPAVGKH